uniref:Uncharacterized protein n=1 Tax=Romanomermis culicivorax TaxID=13658 RepID=A0A915HH39_ROMCU
MALVAFRKNLALRVPRGENYKLRANATSEMGCMTSSRALQRFYSDLNGKFNKPYTPDPLGQRLICNSSDFCNGKMTSAAARKFYDAAIFLAVT